MQRYFVQDDNINKDKAIITDGDFHHIRNVMRFNIGDELIITSYSGDSYKAIIDYFAKKEVGLKLTDKLIVKDNTLNISLAQALIKRDNFELVLQKTTELGIKEIFPLRTEHSIIKIEDFSKKKSRYQSIVKEASEQSERKVMPVIHDLCGKEEVNYNDFDYVLIAYARENNKQLLSFIKDIKLNAKVLLIIGPEGGFSESEIIFFESKGKLVSLGNTILRSETAAIYFTSIFRLLWEENQ